MKLLLDTHIAIWALNDDPQLSPTSYYVPTAKRLKPKEYCHQQDINYETVYMNNKSGIFAI